MKTVSLLLTGLLVLLLLAAGYFGIVEGLGLVRQAHTPLEILPTASELLYGIAAVGALVALASRHRSAQYLLILWAVLVSITAALAPPVWGGSSAVVGAESGVAAALLIGLVLWGWNRTLHKGG